MNVGVRETRADVVALLDQDDLMDPAKIELVSGVDWDRPGIGLAFGRFRTFTTAGPLDPPDQSFYSMFPRHPDVFDGGQVIDIFLAHGYRFGGAGGTAVHRRSWIDLGGFVERYAICWDRDFALRAAIRGWRTAYLAADVCRHRLHNSNLEQAEGGLRGFVEGTSALLDVWQASAHLLPPARRTALLAELRPRLAGTGYWERSRGRYLSALRFYWHAARFGQPVTAMAGISRVVAQAALRSVRWSAPRGPADGVHLAPGHR
jgi:hypothetical protein